MANKAEFLTGPADLLFSSIVAARGPSWGDFLGGVAIEATNASG